MAENPPKQAERVISGDKARQGEIILRTPARRFVFIAGLVGAVILALLIDIWPHL
jgi:hypothetical protein